MSRSFVICSTLLLIGCSTETRPYPTADVEGLVFVLGNPLEHGTIAFMPEPGTRGTAVGAVIERGGYAVKHVPLGTHRVLIQPAPTETAAVQSTGDASTHAVGPSLPAKYRNGVITEVKASGRVDFDLNDRQ